jgi:hypothetical protein
MGLVKRAQSQWDRVAGTAIVLGGLGVLIAGCVGVAAAAETRDQLSYLISGGILGLFLLGVGCTLWLSADLRDAWRKIDALQSDLANGGRINEITLPETNGVLVTGDGMTLFHRPDCQLVTGKPVEVAPRSAHEGRGLQACGVCGP